MKFLDSLSDHQARALWYDPQFWLREKQLPPPGDWRIWILRAGRGFGKNRTGTHWVHSRAMEFPGRWIALVAKTPAEARDLMIEGPSGFLKMVDPAECPYYEPSKRRLSWANGSWATIFSSEEPDQLRGFSGDTAWLDEFAKWRNPKECLLQLEFGMRECSNDRPRIFIGTTPRPIPIMKEIQALPSTVTVTGSSFENAENLDESYITNVLERLKGTTLGRQEIYAEDIEQAEGALWKRTLIEAGRVIVAPDLARIVVAIDPAVTSTKDSDETGIVVAGRTHDGHAYVLDDLSLRASPDTWARKAIYAYRTWKADRVIGEANNGGDMIELVLHTVDPAVSYRKVSASRGKTARAEPVVALYEQGRVSHVGSLPDLEDQMCTWEASAGHSPDRLDALVWALTELLLDCRTPGDLGVTI
jgi:phage terminase large subunit-like protein